MKKLSPLSKLAVIGLSIFTTLVPANAITFQVNNLNASGADSLKQAFIDASANANTPVDDIIQFTVGGAITPTPPLAAVTELVTLDTNGFSPDINGDITGVGQITKTGTGSLILTPTGAGNNNYSGDTILTTGTLQAAITNAFSANSKHIVDAILNLNNLSQSIGGLESTGSSGDVQLGTATLTSTSTTSGTYLGIITSTTGGKFTKAGTGTLTLAGANDYNGATTINAGKLEVSGSLSGTTIAINTGATLSVTGSLLATSPVTVNSGGTLMGAGSINGDVTNESGGTYSPGNSIGTQAITGNYTHMAGGILNIEIQNSDGSTPITDLITVTGTAEIQGGTVNFLPLSPSTFKLGDAFDFISAGVLNLSGAPSTGFTTITSTIGLFKVTVQKKSGSPTILQMVLGSNLTNLITGGNPGIVATYLDTFTLTTGTDLHTAISALHNLGTTAQLRSALNQLHPAHLIQLTNGIICSQASISQHLSGHTRSIRVDAPLPEKGKIWVQGLGRYLDCKCNDDNLSFKDVTGGVILGSDLLFDQNITAGIAGSYVFNDTEWKLPYSKAKTHSLSAHLYSHFLIEQFFVEASVLAGYDFFDLERKITFTTIDRTAASNYHAYHLGGHLSSGLIIPYDIFEFQPFVGFDYIYLGNESFTETEADSLNLDIHKFNTDLLKSEIGLITAAHRIDESGLHWTGSLKLSYVNQTPLQKNRIQASLAGGGTFTTQGLDKTAHFISPGVTLANFNPENGLSLTLNYQANIGAKCHSHDFSLRGTKLF